MQQNHSALIKYILDYTGSEINTIDIINLVYTFLFSLPYSISMKKP